MSSSSVNLTATNSTNTSGGLVQPTVPGTAISFAFAVGTFLIIYFSFFAVKMYRRRNSKFYRHKIYDPQAESKAMRRFRHFSSMTRNFLLLIILVRASLSFWDTFGSER